MADVSPASDRRVPPQIDTTVPHSARIWNYWLGGKDYYEVDRSAGDQFAAHFPAIADTARAFREFLGRAIHHLAGEVGVRQFLDVGTGLPTADNTHEVAQRAAPGARIVYVDNDPLVLAHARALLTSTPEGATDYVHADLHDTDRILAEAARTLDLDEPVALILSGILGHLADHEEALAIVRRLLDPLPPGSHLVVCDGTDTDEVLNEAQEQHNEGGASQYHLRSPEQIAGYFGGLELLEPGVVPCSRWRPETSTTGVLTEAHAYSGVGRKP
ncbi:S-adenosyl methyltransferase [Streptomyces carminius]|uniref:S-adenosyl methyltransferase n=1 Tax=Streptomyces carminius TaxID=2665496 RepID=A0A2M8LTI3_9ACTN|nr:SAM-dependent methyltransferase [Streptomyces carminius]PJE95255.1 S-adenosyl methyltransferase [Streptomyces carminius]